MQYPDFSAKGPTPCSTARDLDQFVPDYLDRSINTTVQIREAKKFCEGCPYKTECFAWAMQNNERGVWGGTSDRDRSKIKRVQSVFLDNDLYV